MTNFKLLAAAIAVGGFATAACAQDATYETKTETLDATVTDSFSASDANADGALDREEFRVFVDTKAAAGHSGAYALAESGDYDGSFLLYDVNADGMLDAGELADMSEAATIDETPVEEMVEPEEG